MHRHAAALLLIITGQAAAQSGAGLTAAAPTTAQGVVFADENANGVRDGGERGLPGIRVSNGREIVLTGSDGGYEIGIDDDDIVFVIKPRGWMTPVDENNLPRFYYIHKPAGSPGGLDFVGVEPTGPLPDSIDFPLTRHEEPARFRAVLFGDPQPRNVREVEYLAHDVVEELVGVDAAFGVTLGDIVFDDLSVFEPYIETVALVGLPWYNVLGNHDQNYDVPSDELADETYERHFGPATYSFDYGPVHYVVIDNVFFYRNEKDKAAYRGGLTEEQMRFLAADLGHVAKDQLVVYMMHIPLVNVEERAEFFDIIKDYPHTLSVSAHTHTLEHHFLGEEHGNHSGRPHHHYVAVTACGSWWSGPPDERGIPQTAMADGAPNGYTIVTFDGSGYSMEFKAARRPADEQMHIWAPEEVSTGELGSIEIVVNVYAGSEKSVVEMRAGGGEWTPLRHERRPDPYYLAAKALEEGETPPPGRKLPKPAESSHVWVGTLPEGLTPGGHLIEIRTVDQFGQEYRAQRVIRVR
jgi:hypothetical protein